MCAARVSETKPVILICIGALWPGNDASGPNLSIKMLASALASDFEVRILARDRPFGATEPLTADTGWTDQGYAKIRYCSISGTGARGLASILRDTPHDVLWLNGFFDREFTLPALVLRRLKAVPSRPAILSPRGEFAPGALSLKTSRKNVYLSMARRMSLLSDVTIHATSDSELDNIRTRFPWAAHYAVAGNVRPLLTLPPYLAKPTGAPLRIVFVGRVSPVKNLDYALNVLSLVRTRVALEIYGPAQDAAYAAACQTLAGRLPANVSATFRGEVANDDIPDLMARSDLFFLPTKGENFGHAIFEALSCGVPVLISDQTPWRSLQARAAGWDLPLDDPQAFAAAIDDFACAPEQHRQAFRSGARAAAEAYAAASTAATDTKALIDSLVKRPVAHAN